MTFFALRTAARPGEATALRKHKTTVIAATWPNYKLLSMGDCCPGNMIEMLINIFFPDADLL